MHKCEILVYNPSSFLNPPCSSSTKGSHTLFKNFFNPRIYLVNCSGNYYLILAIIFYSLYQYTEPLIPSYNLLAYNCFSMLPFTVSKSIQQQFLLHSSPSHSPKYFQSLGAVLLLSPMSFPSSLDLRFF